MLRAGSSLNFLKREVYHIIVLCMYVYMYIILQPSFYIHSMTSTLFSETSSINSIYKYLTCLIMSYQSMG